MENMKFVRSVALYASCIIVGVLLFFGLVTAIQIADNMLSVSRQTAVFQTYSKLRYQCFSEELVAKFATEPETKSFVVFGDKNFDFYTLQRPSEDVPHIVGSSFDGLSRAKLAKLATHVRRFCPQGGFFSYIKK